jgi:hypothetical protein
MGARSSKNTTQNNRSDGHLLEYFRNTFVRGGGGTNAPIQFLILLLPQAVVVVELAVLDLPLVDLAVVQGLPVADNPDL